MENMNVEVAAILVVLFVVATQIGKNIWPETFERYRKYVTWFLMGAGGLINVLWYLSENAPFPVGTNDFQIVRWIVTAVVLGIGAGLSATGLYSAGHNLDPRNIKSVATILAEKHGSFARIEVTDIKDAPVKTEPVVEQKVVEETEAKVVEEVVEKPVKKSRKSNKKGN
jgi:hypothetical protein